MANQEVQKKKTKNIRSRQWAFDTPAPTSSCGVRQGRTMPPHPHPPAKGVSEGGMGWTPASSTLSYVA